MGKFIATIIMLLAIAIIATARRRESDRCQQPPWDNKPRHVLTVVGKAMTDAVRCKYCGAVL